MKIAHFDIETAPALGYFWDGRLYETDILEVKEDGYIMCFSYQWNHLSDIHWVGQPQFGAFKKKASDDTGVVKALWNLFNEADVLVAHNGKQFDVRKANARFLLLGLPPPSPYKVVDTKNVAKKYFALPSNKLDEISRQLDSNRKMPHTGKKLWFDCMKRDQEAWRIMEEYNRHDVVLLKEAYDRLLPWMDGHPNRNVYEEVEHHCTKCGSVRLRKEGFDYTKTTKVQMYSCNNCGGWSRGQSIKVTSTR